MKEITIEDIKVVMGDLEQRQQILEGQVRKLNESMQKIMQEFQFGRF